MYFNCEPAPRWLALPGARRACTASGTVPTALGIRAWVLVCIRRAGETRIGGIWSSPVARVGARGSGLAAVAARRPSFPADALGLCTRVTLQHLRGYTFELFEAARLAQPSQSLDRRGPHRQAAEGRPQLLDRLLEVDDPGRDGVAKLIDLGGDVAFCTARRRHARRKLWLHPRERLGFALEQAPLLDDLVERSESSLGPGERAAAALRPSTSSRSIALRSAEASSRSALAAAGVPSASARASSTSARRTPSGAMSASSRMHQAEAWSPAARRRRCGRLEAGAAGVSPTTTE